MNTLDDEMYEQLLDMIGSKDNGDIRLAFNIIEGLDLDDEQTLKYCFELAPLLMVWRTHEYNFEPLVNRVVEKYNEAFKGMMDTVATDQKTMMIDGVEIDIRDVLHHKLAHDD
jgi:hypothetical protein